MTLIQALINCIETYYKKELTELQSQVDDLQEQVRNTNTQSNLKDHAIKRLQSDNAELRCCGNCYHYRSHDCYCHHNWEPYKECGRQGKYRWKWANERSVAKNTEKCAKMRMKHTEEG